MKDIDSMYHYSYDWKLVWAVKPYGSTAPMWAVWHIASNDRVSPWFNLKHEAIDWANIFWRKKVDKEFETIILGGINED